MSVPHGRRNGARVLLERLEKRFDDRPVLSDIELDIRPGEFLTIVGRSGSGKSTLLRILCGLEQPTGGAARILTPEGVAGGAAVRVVFQEQACAGRQARRRAQATTLSPRCCMATPWRNCGRHGERWENEWRTGSCMLARRRHAHHAPRRQRAQIQARAWHAAHPWSRGMTITLLTLTMVDARSRRLFDGHRGGERSRSRP